jgi:hypothetical protein
MIPDRKNGVASGVGQKIAKLSVAGFSQRKMRRSQMPASAIFHTRSKTSSIIAVSRSKVYSEVQRGASFD